MGDRVKQYAAQNFTIFQISYCRNLKEENEAITVTLLFSQVKLCSDVKLNESQSLCVRLFISVDMNSS